MNFLRDVFAQPAVAGWVAFAGSERASRIAEDGVVGSNNAAWQAGTRADYYIEAQRIGYQVVLGGLAGGNMALVDRGLRAMGGTGPCDNSGSISRAGVRPHWRHRVAEVGAPYPATGLRQAPTAGRD